MKRITLLLVLAFAVSLGAPAAVAQSDFKPITGYIAGGYSATLGTTSDYLQGGWDITGGVIWHPSTTNPLGVRFDIGYDYWGATNKTIRLGNELSKFRIDDGHGSMWSFALDAIWDFKGKGPVGGYVGLGIGGYNRYVQLTQTVWTAGYICDPWWGYCYYAPYYGDAIVADRSVWSFGYNATAGITFEMQNGGAIFLEARYHYVDTDKATEYLPINIGWRF
jgi:opacity protein-like surface antigen